MIDKIVKILKAHHIEVVTINGKGLFAIEEWTDRSGKSGKNLIDITNWSVKDAYEWLGY